jgi:hypothetical protein
MAKWADSWPSAEGRRALRLGRWRRRRLESGLSWAVPLCMTVEGGDSPLRCRSGPAMDDAEAAHGGSPKQQWPANICFLPLPQRPKTQQSCLATIVSHAVTEGPEKGQRAACLDGLVHTCTSRMGTTGCRGHASAWIGWWCLSLPRIMAVSASLPSLLPGLSAVKSQQRRRAPLTTSVDGERCVHDSIAGTGWLRCEVPCLASPRL